MAIKKKIYSFRGGDIIDTEEFHDGKYGAPGEKRIKRKKATPEEIERVNKRNKEKRCRQRMLTYFREGDLFATLTYKVEERPPDMTSAKKDFSKFIRKIRTEYKKRGIELYWIRNIEMGTRGAWHLKDGIVAYGQSSLHAVACVTAKILNEDGDVKYKAYPNCTITNGLSRTVDNDTEDVAMLDLEIAVMPDENGEGMYEAVEKDLQDATAKTKWMEEFSRELVELNA